MKKLTIIPQRKQIVEIFEQSMIYAEPPEMGVRWSWPKSTWMQKRLEIIKNAPITKNRS